MTKLLSGLLKLFGRKKQTAPEKEECVLQNISEYLWCGTAPYTKAEQNLTENVEPSKNEPDQLHSEH